MGSRVAGHHISTQLLIGFRHTDGKERYGAGPVDISAEAVELLEVYDWPGNVRELEIMMRGLALTDTGQISVDDVPRWIGAIGRGSS